jgi:ABC-type lipoprotein release transport system permease subunit
MILVRLALRNLWLHKVKSFVLGFVLMFGTILVIAGNTLIDNIDRTMATSLIDSVTGHLQITSAAGEDDMQVFGNFDGSTSDVGSIGDFERVSKALSSLPNVKTVVPMAIENSIIVSGNVLERKLQELREAVNANDNERRKALQIHVRRIIDDLVNDLQNVDAIADMDKVRIELGDKTDILAKAQSDALWEQFDTEPLDVLEFLENEITDLALDKDLLWLRYIATDPQLFEKTFSRFEVVDGTMIPRGKRGLLFSKHFYEERLKNKTARRLDKIEEKRDDGQTIEDCEDCQQWIERNKKEVSSLLVEIDDSIRAKLAPVLAKHLAMDAQTPLRDLLAAFMDMDDSNFEQRYQTFYDKVAPHLVMYRINVNDDVVLSAYTRSGYRRTDKVHVYGTYHFKGLERSKLAGGFAIMELATFRNLYTYMTDEIRKEQADIRSTYDLPDELSRESTEALFGEEDTDDEKPEESDEPVAVTEGEMEAITITDSFDPNELTGGVVLNAAIILHDGEKLEETIAAIEALNKEQDLGIKITTWRDASGIIAKFIDVIRIVLYTALFLIFAVALVIINNTLVMATAERTREIGTMRAIGAQRRFVIWMFLTETGALTVIAGGLGALIAVGLLQWARAVGIPAFDDVFFFLFGGPRLYPEWNAGHVGIGLLAIAGIALASTLYPARLAARISPREAMQGDD